MFKSDKVAHVYVCACVRLMLNALTLALTFQRVVEQPIIVAGTQTTTTKVSNKNVSLIDS